MIAGYDPRFLLFMWCLSIMTAILYLFTCTLDSQVEGDNIQLTYVSNMLHVPLLDMYTSLSLDRLTAEDVMNPDLKYLYPITRVGSIVSQLRTTAHSAFLIVTPVSLDKVHQKPQTMAHHTPQLYSRREPREHALSIDSGTAYVRTPFGFQLSCVVGFVCVCVCLSVTQHLTSRAMNRSTNNTTYSASGIGRNICRVFSETAAFESYGVKTK